MPKRIHLLAAAACLLPAVSGAQLFYTGATNGSSWGVPSNWSTGVVPGPANDVQLGYSNIGVLAPVYTSPIQIWGINAAARNIKAVAPLDMRSGQLDIYGDYVGNVDARASGYPNIDMRSSRLFFQTSADLKGTNIQVQNGINYLDIWTGQTLALDTNARIFTAPGAILQQSTFFYRPGAIVNRGQVTSNSVVQLTPSEFVNFGSLSAGSNYLGAVDTSRPNLEIATQSFYNFGFMDAYNGGTQNVYCPEFLNLGQIAVRDGSKINIFANEFYATSNLIQANGTGVLNVSGNLHMDGDGTINLEPNSAFNLNGDLYGYGKASNAIFTNATAPFAFQAPARVVRSIRSVSGPGTFFAGLVSNGPNGSKEYVRISNCTTPDVLVEFVNRKVIIDGFNPDVIRVVNSEILFPGYKTMPSNFHAISGTSFLVLNDGQKLATRRFGGTTNNKILASRLIVEGSSTSEFWLGNCEINSSSIELRGPTHMKLVGPVNAYQGSITLPPIVVSKGGGLLFQDTNLQPYSIETEANSGSGIHIQVVTSNPLQGWNGRVTINPGTTLRLQTADPNPSPGVMKCTTMLLNGHLDAASINTDSSPAGAIYFLVRGEVILGPKFTYNVPSGWSLSNGPSGLWLRKN